MSVIGAVAGIWRFPFKSMQGEEVAEVALGGDGIPGDRTWALRDVETGKLVSAKRPRLWRPLLECRATGIGDEVTVELPGGETFSVLDERLAVALGELLGREVSVEAAREPQQGFYASDWLEIEGVSLAGEFDLPMNIAGEGTAFVDVSVLHVLTTSSLAALGAVAPPTGTDTRRFRPSILLDTPGLEGFAEDGWAGRTLRVGEVEVLVGEATPRCIMPTLAQGELAALPDLTRTLAAAHKVTTSLGTFPCLGAYARVGRPGPLRLGTPIELA